MRSDLPYDHFNSLRLNFKFPLSDIELQLWVGGFINIYEVLSSLWHVIQPFDFIYDLDSLLSINLTSSFLTFIILLDPFS